MSWRAKRSTRQGTQPYSVFYRASGITNFDGQFNEFDGTLTLDTENPDKSRVNVTIQAASIDTDVEALDKHLRSPLETKEEKR